jgi:hypothetical protein
MMLLAPLLSDPEQDISGWFLGHVEEACKPYASGQFHTRVSAASE